MDLLVEQRLHEALGELDPSIGLAGEETGADYDQPLFWLVDPIDATEAFIRGLPFATNMIVLIHNGEPIMSVIYNFLLDEYFHAVKGGGATKNGHPIHVHDRPIDRSYVAFGNRFKNPKLFGITDRLRHKVQGMPSMAASGYMYSMLASGALDGIITYNGRAKAWDHAPGSLLVQEAGGRFVNLFSDTYDYLKLDVIAATPSIYAELKEFLESEITKAGDRSD